MGSIRESVAPRRRPRRAPVPAPRGRVLVVDDEPYICRAVADTLRDEGYEVRCAADGVEALDTTQSWDPDLILLDLMMPMMNGWTFVEAFRQLPRLRATVVAMTAAGPAAVRSASGMVAEVLPKPLDFGQLVQIVDYYTGTRRAS